MEGRSKQSVFSSRFSVKNKKLIYVPYWSRWAGELLPHIKHFRMPIFPGKLGIHHRHCHHGTGVAVSHVFVRVHVCVRTCACVCARAGETHTCQNVGGENP